MGWTTSNPRFFLRLLKMGSFERHPNGGWRFGLRTIADSVVDRLVSEGRARIEGDRVILAGQEASRAV
jgi:hypothetical protein